MHKNAYKNLYFISNLNKGNNDFERKKESKILGLADHSRRVRGLLARQVLLGGGEDRSVDGTLPAGRGACNKRM